MNGILDSGTVCEIHIIPYSHHDFAWTNLRQWHIGRYLQCFIEVLDTMREDGEFTWLIDNAVHSLVPFLQYCPGRVEEFQSRVREGRIAVANGGFCLARPNYSGDETFIRNIVEGKRFFEETLGAAGIDVFLNADTGCGHSQLPQILALSGHRFYRFQRPEEALDKKGIPRQFVWEGLDGSRVVVSRGRYTGFRDGKFTNWDVETRWQEIRSEFLQQELGDKSDPFPASGVLWLSNGDDDTRPEHNVHDEPISVRAFMREWNRRERLPMRFSTPGRHFSRLAETALPVFRGVPDPCDMAYNAPIRGENSMWRMRQKLERLLVRAESFAAMAALTAQEYPERELSALWRSQFEISGHAIEWAFRQDFEELHALASSACASTGALIRRVCQAIAGRAVAGKGIRFAALNPLNWRRKETVQLHVTDPFGVRGFDVTDGLGRAVDYQIVGDYRGDKWFYGYERYSVDILAEVAVPAMGYTSLHVESNGSSLEERIAADRPAFRENPERITIDNGAIAVMFASGAIERIADAATGRLLFSGEAGKPMGTLVFHSTKPERDWLSSWDTIERHRAAPERWALAEQGPLRWVYRASGCIGDSRYSLDFVMNRGEPAIGFELRLDCQGREGYYAVDFAADDGTKLFADIPFGVEQRDLRQEHYGAVPGAAFDSNGCERGQPGQYWARSWTAFETHGEPAAVISENCSIYWRLDRERSMVSLLLHRCMELEARRDSWIAETDPSIEGRGRHGFRYHLYFPKQQDCFPEIARFSRSNTQPIEAAPVLLHDSAADLEPEHSFVTADRGNVLVSAFYRQAGCYTLRLFEAGGLPTEVNLLFGFAVSGAWPADLLGNRLNDGDFTADLPARRVAMRLRPWQIATVHLQTDAPCPTDSERKEGERN